MHVWGVTDQPASPGAGSHRPSLALEVKALTCVKLSARTMADRASLVSSPTPPLREGGAILSAPPRGSGGVHRVRGVVPGQPG